MPIYYTNEEYGDIIFVYGFCEENALKAEQKYRRKFSFQTMLRHRMCSTLGVFRQWMCLDTECVTKLGVSRK